MAQKLGKSRSLVANALRLLKLPASVAELLLDGSLSNGHARALLSLDSEELQVRVAAQIVDNSLSVRETEALIHRVKAGKDTVAPLSARSDKPPVSGLTANQKWLEDQFREFFGLKVRLEQKVDKGRLIIEFFSREDLERLYALMGKCPEAEEAAWLEA